MFTNYFSRQKYLISFKKISLPSVTCNNRFHLSYLLLSLSLVFLLCFPGISISDTLTNSEGVDLGKSDPTLGYTADCKVVDPFPARLVDTSGLTSRHGSIRFKARDGNIITAFTYRASEFDGSGPILFVMHGSGRTAESYLNAFKPIAERHSALAVAPMFDKNNYPTSESYNLGVGAKGTPSGGVYQPAQWRAPADYLYSEIEHLFEAIKTKLNSSQCSYRIFGHSAGGQFTHRLLTFRPDARVFRAAAANSGWYTLPSDADGSDRNYYMPYGLQGSPITSANLKQAFSRELVVLLGSEDTATAKEDSNVRGSTKAEAQGPNRLQRGRAYYNHASSQAAALGSKFTWLTDTVLGAGHDKDEVAASAGWYLFRKTGELPCTPSTAAEAKGLVINEILADPPKGLAGDANKDGTRDANDDEFVELVNTGSSEICLTGWTLGDAAEPERHRFPISTRLAPGAALVVFGGGLPTGNFSGAMVQWAAFGGKINMNNDGDVVTLADPSGKVHSQISWGDCAGVTCAAEHINGSLSLDQATVRNPELTGVWAPHNTVAAGDFFSPGRRADGKPFIGKPQPPANLSIEFTYE
jgi:pimeloyl-ACP methyl ester carboxylesterase